jgi:hypothetical protein
LTLPRGTADFPHMNGRLLVVLAIAVAACGHGSPASLVLSATYDEVKTIRIEGRLAANGAHSPAIPARGV